MGGILILFLALSLASLCFALLCEEGSFISFLAVERVSFPLFVFLSRSGPAWFYDFIFGLVFFFSPHALG